MRIKNSDKVLTVTQTSSESYDVENEVLRRYAEGAHHVESGLCCPTKYDLKFIDIIPKEIIEKDYGCGDPSPYVSAGETVVDLGSGAGKICYILSQKVESKGKVIGVDFNDEMLSLARKYIDEVGDKLGYKNVRFVKAKIQDLALDLKLVQKWLDVNPINSIEQVIAFEAECERLRWQYPLIPDSSVDVVVSNCVLNLVRTQDKEKLFKEIYRVLKHGGRAVISDIVCDEDPTPSILADPELWSGCIAGAFREDYLIEMFVKAGFYGVEILYRQAEPWQVIEGIEFRSVTVRAFKGKEGDCKERYQAVIYKGPWESVCDDDGHTLYRGKNMAVCDKTYSILTSQSGPYSRDIIPVPPREEIPMDKATPFDCKRDTLRHPRETKGLEYQVTITNDKIPCDCGSGEC